MVAYNDFMEILKDIKEWWGAAGEKVVECAYQEHQKMTMTEFLKHCTACGGNWGGMLLSGMRELYPKTYEAIPEEMGPLAFALISNTLVLCGVYCEE